MSVAVIQDIVHEQALHYSLGTPFRANIFFFEADKLLMSGSKLVFSAA
jgi:hypothetical protein